MIPVRMVWPMLTHAARSMWKGNQPSCLGLSYLMLGLLLLLR